MNIPLTKPYFTTDEEREVIRVIRSGWIMQGAKVEEFEQKIARYIGTTYAVAVHSGTAALHLALLSVGIGTGDEVIVPSFSFVATANSVLYTGARPVFVDIDPQTYTIDPAKIESHITPKTKAIIVVHQVGLSADMDPIMTVAKKRHILVIEDAACALGTVYKKKKIGTSGVVGCFSFHPRKSITTGEGGMVVTNDEQIAYLVRTLRSHGIEKTASGERSVYLGYNYRMTDMQAALGLAQFKKLPRLLSLRRKLAKRYTDVFSTFPFIVPPKEPKGYIHTYQSYLLRVRGGLPVRNALMKRLEEKGIACRGSITAIHQEPFYKKRFDTMSLPETEKIHNEGIIIPLYPTMTDREQTYVIHTIEHFFRG